MPSSEQRPGGTFLCGQCWLDTGNWVCSAGHDKSLIDTKATSTPADNHKPATQDAERPSPAKPQLSLF